MSTENNTPLQQWPAGFDRPPAILLVDDEANILSALRRLLRPKGYQTFTAAGGTEALQILSTEVIDIVVSDMRMPGMDGAQLLSEVRARRPNTIRILLTGYADINSAVSAINNGGIFRYISKPWDDFEFLEVIRQALEWSGLQREKDRLEKLTRVQNEELQILNSTLEEKVRQRTGELQTAHQELTLAMEKLKKSFFTTVQVLSNLLELRAPALVGHGRRTADVARRIAEKMKLPPDQVHTVLMAGLLHDIGKIGYNDELFTKPVNKMTPDEQGRMRKHTINGSAALMSLSEMRGVAEIIESHHERWDGNGYPKGLAGHNIPLGARIVALANDYDSAQMGLLTGKRMTAEESKQYMLEGINFRYDPAVVEAFAELIGRTVATRQALERRVNGNQLEEGMILSRDLFSPDGVLLLATGFVIDESLIRQIRGYERAFGKDLVIIVRA